MLSPLQTLLSLAVLAVLTALAPTSASAAPPETCTVALVGGRPLQLELLVPEGPGPHPVLVWVHGGGWRGGDHRRLPGFTGPALQKGFAVASLDYRLSSETGQWGEAPVVWPAQLDDVKAGIRWLRANADTRRLDPDRIYAWGHSAGGHLVAMLALTNDEPAFEGRVGSHLDTSSRVEAVVDSAGPSDLFLIQDGNPPGGNAIDHDAADSPESLLLGAGEHGHSLGEIKANRKRTDWPWKRLRLLGESASPIRQVDDEDDALLILIHGRKDRLVPFAQAERLAERCRQRSVPVETIWLDEVGHDSMRPEPGSQALDRLRSMAFPATVDDDSITQE